MIAVAVADCGRGFGVACGVDAMGITWVGTLVSVDADVVGVLPLTSAEPMVPVTVGVDSAADEIDGVVTDSAWWSTGDAAAAMVSAVCDEFAELSDTPCEGAALFGDEVSGAGAFPVVAEAPELLEVAEDPLVNDALALLLGLVDDEPVVGDPPVVPLVVVVPPPIVVVVEPVLPPLEDTELVGEV